MSGSGSAWGAAVWRARENTLDRETQVARWSFPEDRVLCNNWRGVTTLLEDGDLLLGGFFAVKRYDVGHPR